MNYYVSPMYLEAGIFTELICLIHILYIDSIFSVWTKSKVILRVLSRGGFFRITFSSRV